MGCIDGTHIPIQRPHVESQDYFNYHRLFSLSVEAVCDAKGLFMDEECRWPVSVHDAKVFSNSFFGKKLHSGQLPQTFNNLLPGHNKIPNYVIGDSAYPLLPYCIKEFQSCKSDVEMIFNNLLKCSRNPIECPFGRTKARWSILSRTMELKLTTEPNVVLACFVLHDFCKLYHDEIDAELVRYRMAENITNKNMYINAPDLVYSDNTGDGEAIRNTLTKYIQVQLPHKY
ncbi:protein ALP1-like [Xenia sp. Carnegie-2017]|uniref:protein ALP1-like n=1 Tax=Xenia sp. Carnegie-2017 TaxID=2897299 RepID=UPI001F044C49|nr:protein ALP1-like [Xenia sp. Carnegie-2017]